jgi:YbbR domain-containing protein
MDSSELTVFILLLAFMVFVAVVASNDDNNPRFP